MKPTQKRQSCICDSSLPIQNKVKAVSETETVSQKVYRNRLLPTLGMLLSEQFLLQSRTISLHFLKDVIPAVQQRALVPVHNVPDQFLSFTIGYNVNIV